MNWRIVGASVRGASHIRSGTPCEDAHRWRELPGGVLVAAVSDGAGSAPRAELGAAVAAQAAIEEFSKAFTGVPTGRDWEQMLRASIEAGRRALEQVAERKAALCGI